MGDRNYNNGLDELIRISMKIEEKPTAELNNNLKASLYKRESEMRKMDSARVIPLWYIPMILNFLIFALFGILAMMLIANPYLSVLAAAACIYAGIAGIIITAVGVKRADMKETISLRIGKRGVSA